MQKPNVISTIYYTHSPSSHTSHFDTTLSSQVHFSSMESRRRAGLYLAGEVLDVDGVTGGYNFQSAWTTGYIAGSSCAQSLVLKSEVNKQ